MTPQEIGEEVEKFLSEGFISYSGDDVLYVNMNIFFEENYDLRNMKYLDIQACLKDSEKGKESVIRIIRSNNIAIGKFYKNFWDSILTNARIILDDEGKWEMIGATKKILAQFEQICSVINERIDFMISTLNVQSFKEVLIELKVIDHINSLNTPSIYWYLYQYFFLLY